MCITGTHQREVVGTDFRGLNTMNAFFCGSRLLHHCRSKTKNKSFLWPCDGSCMLLTAVSVCLQTCNACDACESQVVQPIVPPVGESYHSARTMKEVMLMPRKVSFFLSRLR